jgi:hypothetical protein
MQYESYKKGFQINEANIFFFQIWNYSIEDKLYNLDNTIVLIHNKMIKDLMPFLVLGQLGMILKFECVHDVNSYT